MDDGREATRCGKFGYETCNGQTIPYIFRYGEKYCSNFILWWHYRIYFHYLKTYEMYDEEACLLNEINKFHNDDKYAQTFSRNDVLVKLDDVTAFFKKQDDCRKKVEFGVCNNNNNTIKVKVIFLRNKCVKFELISILIFQSSVKQKRTHDDVIPLEKGESKTASQKHKIAETEKPKNDNKQPRQTSKIPKYSDDFYEVEDILDYKKHSNGVEKVLIRWKGYTSDDDTWEPLSSLNKVLKLEVKEKWANKVNGNKI